MPLRPSSRAIALLGLALCSGTLSPGCATIGDLKRTASQDLRCDEDNVIVNPQSRRATATGCGRTARYQKICEDSIMSDIPSCGWILIDAPRSQSQMVTIAPPAASAPPPAKDDSAPTEALGFRFGQDLAAVRATCEDAGHAFASSRKSGNTFYCDGPPRNPGIPVREALTFCDGSLCQLVALAEITADDAGDRKLHKVLAGLVDQYGRPDLSHSRIPKGCGNRTARCIHDGQATWNSTWRWSRQRYLNVIAKPKGEGVQLRLEYVLAVNKTAKPSEDSEIDTDAF